MPLIKLVYTCEAYRCSSLCPTAGFVQKSSTACNNTYSTYVLYLCTVPARARAQCVDRKDNAELRRTYRIPAAPVTSSYVPKLTSENFDVWDSALQDLDTYPVHVRMWGGTSTYTYELSLLEGQRADEDDIKAIGRRAAWDPASSSTISLNDDSTRRSQGRRRQAR